MYLIPLCAIFSYGLVWDRIPEVIAEFLLGISGDSPYMLLGIIVIFLIIAGMFVDGSVLILMLTPIFLPIARQIGFDPVHFGLVFVLTITMGNMTPPWARQCMQPVRSWIVRCKNMLENLSLSSSRPSSASSFWSSSRSLRCSSPI
jgi:TRAP-type C4-dicarboxylate transport system permease large subunit